MSKDILKTIGVGLLILVTFPVSLPLILAYYIGLTAFDEIQWHQLHR